MSYPEHWKQIQLGDVLNEGQLQELERILGKHDDPLDAVGELKVYLRQFEGQLQEAGLLPDYAAYAIAAKAAKII